MKMRHWLAALVVGLAAGQGWGAEFSWNFNGGNLATTGQAGGTATLGFFNMATELETSFGDTGIFPPDFADGPGGYLHHPALSDGGRGGYPMSYTNVGPNGGGAYVNTYTVIMDVYLPQLNWTALFNTDPGHSNDADWYVAPDGALGIGDLGYSAPGTVTAQAWHRLAFVRSMEENLARYYVDGVQVFTGGAGALDGRMSLYTSLDLPPQLTIHGEGDGSGNYSNEVYLGSLFFSDTALDHARVTALGGATAGGVAVVPGPGTLILLGLGGAAVGLRGRRRV